MFKFGVFIFYVFLVWDANKAEQQITTCFNVSVRQGLAGRFGTEKQNENGLQLLDVFPFNGMMIPTHSFSTGLVISGLGFTLLSLEELDIL